MSISVVVTDNEVVTVSEVTDSIAITFTEAARLAAGADADAIHDNVASEISAVAEKISPVNADFILIEDSAAANAKKRIQVGNLPSTGETNTSSNVGTAGVGVYKQKTGVDLEFKKINAGSAAITITDDTGNDEIDIDIGSSVATLTDNQTLTNKTMDGADNTILDVASAHAIHHHVRKGSASTIAAGTPIYVTGYNVGGGYVEVEEADASNSAKMPAIGITDESITNSATGHATQIGKVEDLNTSMYSEGDTLYVAAGGGLTSTQPTGTNLVQGIALVSRSHASAGVIYADPGRQNDIPNLPETNFWLGDGSGVPAESTVNSLTADASPNGAVDYVMTYDASASLHKKVLLNNLPTGSGEANTSSNVGTAGVGVFKQKTGVDFEFKKINAGSSKVTITDDTGNNEIDIDVVEANIAHDSLSGFAALEHLDWSADQGATNIHSGNYTNTVYSHPNHTGDVTSTGDGAQVIATSAVTLAKMANMATDSFLGRDTVGTGVPEVLSAATVRTILNVENGATADQTDAEIETAYQNQVSTVSQAEAEAGIATTIRTWTALRVAQAIAALESGGSSFDTGTLMLFQQTAAPTGWTKQVTHNDKALRVVSGAAGSGGTDAYSTSFSSGKATDAHTLTTAELPSHGHAVTGSYWKSTGGANNNPAAKGAAGHAAVSPANAGSGSSHVHTLTLDLQYVDIIIASKDA